MTMSHIEDDMQLHPAKIKVSIFFNKHQLEYIWNKIHIQPNVADIQGPSFLFLPVQAHEASLVPNRFYHQILHACMKASSEKYNEKPILIETTFPVLQSLLDITRDPSHEKPSTIQVEIRNIIADKICAISPESQKLRDQIAEDLLSTTNIDFSPEKNDES